ncbi:AAA family ATPase [Mesorhizobium sp. J428]|uniref:AAA family ATPase n=1 Tax=Mesorhizobium sp. J428 TaxID=2898440 RepID=UPI0035B1AC46
MLINGAYSTGKTTLLQSCVDLLRSGGRDVIGLDETARHCPFPLNRDQSFLSTQWLIHRQISREIESFSEENILIIDRGIPDIFAHYLETCDRLGTTSPEIEVLVDFLIIWCNTYDLVITTEIDQVVDIIDDGLRIPDKRYRELMGQYNISALSRLMRRSVTLPRSVQSDSELLHKFIVETIIT